MKENKYFLSKEAVEFNRSFAEEKINQVLQMFNGYSKAKDWTRGDPNGFLELNLKENELQSFRNFRNQIPEMEKKLTAILNAVSGKFDNICFIQDIIDQEMIEITEKLIRFIDLIMPKLYRSLESIDYKKYLN